MLNWIAKILGSRARVHPCEVNVTDGYSGVLFLDIDGVLHPGCSETFSRRELFESLMREFPAVGLVVSSDWKLSCDLEYLKALFSDDIAARILGTTPNLESSLRSDEILMAVRAMGIRHWIAVDDLQSLFPAGWPHVVFTDSRIGLEDQVIQRLRLEFQGWG